MLVSVSFDQLGLDSNRKELILKDKKWNPLLITATNLNRKQLGRSKIILDVKLKEL